MNAEMLCFDWESVQFIAYSKSWSQVTFKIDTQSHNLAFDS